MTSDVLDLIKRNKIDNIAYRTPTDSPEKILPTIPPII